MNDIEATVKAIVKRHYSDEVIRDMDRRDRMAQLRAAISTALHEAEANGVKKYQAELESLISYRGPKDIPKCKQYCGFCGRGDIQVEHLVEGPSVCICEECIENCGDVVKARKADSAN